MVLGGSFLGATALATVAGARVTNRRWARNGTGGTVDELLAISDGREFTVHGADGARLWATVIGRDHPDSPLVVLSHCWTGDHRIWAPVARQLAHEHRVVLYDQRGHGRSTVGTDGLTLDALADDLRAVLDHVDAADAVVAGHSMGGMTAQTYAVRHADHAARTVRHLVLVATAADGMTYGETYSTRASALIGREVIGRVVGSDRFGALSVRGVFGQRPELAHLEATALTFARTPGAVRAGLLYELSRIDLGAWLSSVEIPATIVVGSRDTLTPPARSRRMHELLPNTEMITLKGCGHMLPFEATHDVVAVIAAAARTVAHPKVAHPTIDPAKVTAPT